MVFHFQREEDRQDVYSPLKAHSHLVKTRYLAPNIVRHTECNPYVRQVHCGLPSVFLSCYASKYRVFMLRISDVGIHVRQVRVGRQIRAFSHYASKYRVFINLPEADFIAKRFHLVEISSAIGGFHYHFPCPWGSAVGRRGKHVRKGDMYLKGVRRKHLVLFFC